MGPGGCDLFCGSSGGFEKPEGAVEMWPGGCELFCGSLPDTQTECGESQT